MTPTCECPIAGYCERYKRKMWPLAHQICQGTSGRTPEQEAVYRANWAKLAKSTVHPTPSEIKERVGDELEKMFSWFGQVKSGSCGCKQLQAKCNAWGVAGCRENFGLILTKLCDAAFERGLTVGARPVMATFLTAAIWRAAIRQHSAEKPSLVE